MNRSEYWENICTNPYAHDELGACEEMEPPFPGDSSHPTSSHLLQVEYRAHKAEDIRYREEWTKANKDTWNL